LQIQPKSMQIIWKTYNVKPVDRSGKRKVNIWKAKLMSSKLIIKTKILEICTDA